MIKKFSFITFSLILISFIYFFPSFAENNINMDISGGTSSASSSSSATTPGINGTSSYTSNSVRVSTSSDNDDEFGLTNVLNIMLVVIGILLVLLAIAILIRLNS